MTRYQSRLFEGDVGRGGMGRESRMEGRRLGGGLTMTAARMTKTAAVVKGEIIISWRPWGRTGWSSFGHATKKEGGGGTKEKESRTGQDGGSAAQPSITGPYGTKELTTTMDVAATRRMRTRSLRIKKGGGVVPLSRKRAWTMSLPPHYYYFPKYRTHRPLLLVVHPPPQGTYS